MLVFVFFNTSLWNSVFCNLLLESGLLYGVSPSDYVHVVPYLLWKCCRQHNTLTISEVNNTCQKSWHFFVIIYLIILAYTIWVLGKKQSCHVTCRSIHDGNTLLKHIPLNCSAVSSQINKHRVEKQWMVLHIVLVKSNRPHSQFAFPLNSKTIALDAFGLMLLKNPSDNRNHNDEKETLISYLVTSVM